MVHMYTSKIWAMLTKWLLRYSEYAYLVRKHYWTQALTHLSGDDNSRYTHMHMPASVTEYLYNVDSHFDTPTLMYTHTVTVTACLTVLIVEREIVHVELL